MLWGKPGVADLGRFHMEETGTILVVDDNDDQRRLVATLLKKQLLTVFEAATGMEGLQCARQILPDLILLDINLPDINGMDVCRQIKADPGMATVLVIHLSAQQTSPLHQAAALESGADGYLILPVNHAELLARVKAMLRIAKARKALFEERQRFQAQLGTREAELETLYENAPVMMCLINKEGLIRHANGRLSEFIGADKAALKDLDACRAFGCAQKLEKQAGAANSPGCCTCAIGQTIAATISAGHSQRPTVVPCRWIRNQVPTELFLSVSSAPIKVSQEPLALLCFEDVTHRKKMEDSLRASEEKFRNVFENMLDVYYEVSMDGRILDVSPSIEVMSKGQYRREEVIGKLSFESYSNPEERNAFLEAIHQQGQVADYEIPLKNRDGTLICCAVSAKLQHDPDGRPVKIIGSIREVTRRKLLEEQLRQAQKMEAIGQLAGGVAHDFNNILSSTLLNLNLLQKTQSLPPGALEMLSDLEKDAQRAASLTRQLLLFSRHENIELKVVDLNVAVKEILKMISRLLGEQISIRFDGVAQPVWLKADIGMLEQVVLNLAINARDAMPNGGNLLIRVDEAAVNPEHVARHPQARQGRFARLCVEDNGCGMDSHVLQHLFEPFFTTKEAGKGTGLGLATVYGIVHQHHGWVEVESTPGAGSLFSIYFAVMEPASESAGKKHTPDFAGGSETILLVEDEETLRNFTARTLRAHGYRVHSAGSGAEAMRLWVNTQQEIDLLLTDMVMPEGITGSHLAEQFSGEKPAVKIIITSGYAGAHVADEADPLPRLTFLPKPYDARTLVKAVRSRLDQP